jgi:RNA polymerase sigma factor (sigma-70 family)
MRPGTRTSSVRPAAHRRRTDQRPASARHGHRGHEGGCARAAVGRIRLCRKWSGVSDVPDGFDDDALVSAVLRRDQGALGEIYRRYGGAVWSLARRVCRDADLADEVCQTVFADLWSRPDRFDSSRGRLRPWLLTQAHARAVDAVRSEEARRRRQEREAQLTPRMEHGFESAVAAASLSAHVRRAVEQLHPDERDAIQLAYFGGHSYRQAAALLGAPEGTVKSRIRAGLDHLRRALGSQEVTP